MVAMMNDPDSIFVMCLFFPSVFFFLIVFLNFMYNCVCLPLVFVFSGSQLVFSDPRLWPLSFYSCAGTLADPSAFLLPLFFFLIISVVLALESLTLHSTAESDSPLVLNFNNEIQLLPAREEWVYTYYLKLY